MGETTGRWTCARSGLRIKLALSIVCLLCSFWHIGFYEGCPLVNHVLYSFCHANVFHLAINLAVLWNIRNQIPVGKALAVAVAASFLPMYASGPTMGLSGFLFSAFGTMWGKTGRWADAAKKALPFILCTMLLPNVNGLLHLYTFVTGYILAYIIKKATTHEE